MDVRTFSFERVLAAPPDVVWTHWVDPELLASWRALPTMTVTDCALEPKPGGRAILDYRDAEGQRYHSDGRVHATKEPEHLVLDFSVRDAAKAVSFTGHYDLTLAAAPEDTRLRLGLGIIDTTVEAVPYIAGIETGWGQVLDNLANAVSKPQHTTKAARTLGKERQP